MLCTPICRKVVNMMQKMRPDCRKQTPTLIKLLFSPDELAFFHVLFVSMIVSSTS